MMTAEEGKRQMLSKRLGSRGAIALLLAVSLLIPHICLMSCGATVSEKEMLDIFAEKYEASLAVNEYIWGKGPEVSEYEKNNSVSVLYVPVSEDAAYRTKDALIEAVRSVYTTEYVDGSIMPRLFDGFGEDADVSPRYSESSGTLTKNVYDGGHELTGRFDTSSAEIEKLTSTTAKIKARYVSESGEVQSVSLLMVLESDGWRFDGPTY